jgi:hypothetical protein
VSETPRREVGVGAGIRVKTLGAMSAPSVRTGKQIILLVAPDEILVVYGPRRQSLKPTPTVARGCSISVLATG